MAAIVETSIDRTIKNKSDDRILVLAKKEGEHTLSTKGMIDNRLFSGDNKLHAKLDPEKSMWYLHFEKGLLPNDFKQHFTSFSKLLSFVKQYYEKRNIEIKEVLD